MGGVCSRSKTKSVKRGEDGATGAGASNNIASSLKAPNAGTASIASFNSRRPDADVNGGGVRANVSRPRFSDSASTGTSSSGTRSSNTNTLLNGNDTFLSMDSPSRDKTAKAASGVVTPTSPAAGAASAWLGSGGARPRPMQAGPSYDTYFPPNHDAGMKLGADKYTGVGASPASQINSSGLQSLASSPSENTERARQGDQRRRRGTVPPRSNPIILTDDDTSMVETASSAFATPRELQRTSSSIAGFPDRSSIVSGGSMTSQRPHGYSYYNSSAVGAEYFAMPSSASPPLSATAALLTPPTASTSPSQRRPAQQQIHPFYRRPSTTRTLSDVLVSRQMPTTRSAVSAGTPLTRQSSIAGSDRFQTCRSYNELSSSSIGNLPLAPSLGGVADVEARLLSDSYSASNVGGASAMGRSFHTCRSADTPMTDALRLSPPAAVTQDSAYRTPLARSHSGASVAEAQNASLLQARATSQTPRGTGALLRAPNAKQLYRKHPAGLLSSCGAAPASEGFSVPPSASNVFLDLPSAPASAAVSTSRHSTTTTIPFATGSHGAEKRRGRGKARTAASAASHHWRSFGEAAAPLSARSLSKSSDFSSAPSLTDTPTPTKTGVPTERQVSNTSAAAGPMGANHGSSDRKATWRRKPYAARDDFPPDPNVPPPATLAMAAAATIPPLRVAESTSERTPNQDMKAVILSPTKSKAHDDDSAAAPEGRATQAYTEPSLPSSDAVAAAHGGSAAMPATSSSSSEHSFSVVLSGRRDYDAAEASRGSLAVPPPPQRPRRQSGSRRLRRSSLGAGGGAPSAGPRRNSASLGKAAGREGDAGRAVAATPAVGAGGGARARAMSVSAPAPLMTNRRPWVPNGRRVATTPSRHDLKRSEPITKRAVNATRTSGEASRRSSLDRPSSMLNKSRGRALAFKTSGRAGASALSASAPTVAAPRHSPGSVSGLRLEGKKRRQQAPTSSSVSLSSAPGARKPRAKRAAGAAAAAAAGGGEPLDTDKEESVVEYALFSGDVMEGEVAGAEAARSAGDDSGSALQEAPAASAALPKPPRQCGSEAEDAAQTHPADFRALTETSIAATNTSSEESVFLPLHAEAQLAAPLSSSATGLQRAGDSHSHPWISSEGEGERDAPGADKSSEDDRAAVAAGFARAVEHEAVPSSDGDERGPVSVSTTSGEETATASSSAEWSNARSPAAKYGRTSAPEKEDAVHTGLVASTRDLTSEVAEERAAPDLRSRSSSSASGPYASEVQMATPR
ncbi:hypothetical protein LSCM1_07977 [Leishmania martiniquensis]|uniref:Uncharacterized protein n=1 Tax=Leishmania martiniquensis TaxID=1580590 RepID=A0A836HSD9_9TRYP|nr:hypothetical protein LSCM1_07977 [Leishmania martiniquensis]